MYIRNSLPFKTILSFAWQGLVIYFILSTTVCVVYIYFEIEIIAISFLPLGTLGTAMAILLGFRNNSAYDRFWEARRLWGGVVNTSRTFARQITTLATLQHTQDRFNIDDLKEFHTEMVYRHLAYVNSLRMHLRQEDMIKRSCWDELGSFLPPEETMALKTKANKPTQLIQKQGERLKFAQEMGLVEDFRHIQLDNTLTTLYDLQGGCERIKNTPLPRQYAIFTHLFVWIFVMLLPFGFVKELGWATIPLAMLVSWIFVTLEQVGRYTEGPFDNTLNDVPMSAICRNIEIDLRQQLGEATDLKPLEHENGIIM